ncbi:hypothetical protein BH20ACT19_BH20ACT19_00260 [soil metagenome]
MDVYEYFHSRERECVEHSLVPDTGFARMFGEEDGSNGQRGIVFANLGLTDRGFLKVWESVVVEGSGIHREAYSYYLIYDDEQKWAYDRDPDHDPPDHGHEGPGHERVETGSVTFLQVVERAWDTVTAEETMPTR